MRLPVIWKGQPDESNRRVNLAVASKFIDGVKNDELRTMCKLQFDEPSCVSMPSLKTGHESNRL